MGQNFSTLVRGKRGKLSGIEPRVLESQASVHTVCSELQGLLLDVILGHAVSRAVY